jgi:hypothetical protein
MPISADQTAVLEMLLTGGQSYDDLDALFGLEEGDTRERARIALEELGGADPDRNVGLTDYILGQADPIGRADAVRHLRQNPDDAELAGRISSELESHFPGAELPKLPSALGGSRFGGRATPAPVAQPAGEPQSPKVARFTPSQTRMFAGLGGAAIVLIAVVLAVTGVFSGDESDAPASGSDDALAGSNPADPTDPTDPSTPIPPGDEISRIPLAPPGGGDAGGAAIVGITDTDQPYLDLVLSNVPEPPENKAYLIWFMFDDDNGYPLPAQIVPTGKNFEDRFPIPIEAAGPISTAVAVELTLSNPEDVLAEVNKAAESNEPQIERPGETILRGDVPQPEQGAGTGDQQAPGEGNPEE